MSLKSARLLLSINGLDKISAMKDGSASLEKKGTASRRLGKLRLCMLVRPEKAGYAFSDISEILIEHENTLHLASPPQDVNSMRVSVSFFDACGLQCKNILHLTHNRDYWLSKFSQFRAKMNILCRRLLKSIHYLLLSPHSLVVSKRKALRGKRLRWSAVVSYAIRTSDIKTSLKTIVR